MINAMLVGRLGRSPDIRATDHGTVCSVSVAADHGFGEHKTTTWVKVSAWRGLGDTLAKLDKGCRIAVAGELYQDFWTDSNGEGHTRLKLDANKINVIDWPDQVKQGPSEPEPEPAKPARKPRRKVAQVVDEELF